MKDREKEIYSLLEKKLSLFQSYLSVTKRIGEAFVEDGNGNPGAFIAERQGLIDQIEKIDSSMKKVIRGGESPMSAGIKLEKIETRLQDIRNLMEEVQPIDEALIAMVQREEEEAKGALLKMRQSRQAVNGYQRIGKYPPKFFDKLR